MTTRLPTSALARISCGSLATFAAALTGASCANLRAPDGANDPAGSGSSGTKQLTLNELYGAQGRVDFNGSMPRARTWIDGARWIERQGRNEWIVVEAASGATSPVADMSRARAAIAAIPGVSEKEADELARPDPARLSADRAALLVNFANDLWVVRLDADVAVRVTSTPDVVEREVSFSPDGKRVAFVAARNVHVGDAVSGGAVARTGDGGETVLNGELDWLYQEEVYGRDNYRGYWWSPDSRTIAFLRLDEARVPVHTIVDDQPSPPVVEREFYPQPGEPNPKVALGLIDVGGVALRFVDLAAYEASDPLVVDVSWTPDARLVYQVQDREQTMLDLRLARADGSNDTLLVHETTPAWVERTESPTWLADGTFLWFSERTGFKHLYRYRGADMLGPVTSGEWEARTLHGVDEARGLVYFSGTERSPIGSDVYVVGLDGTGLKRLSEASGTHAANFSPDFSLYVDAWSDLWTPQQVRLHHADGRLARVIDANEVTAAREYATSRPELLTVPARDGFPMEAMLIKPVEFEATKRYPVMMFVYSGPHSQTVRNAWGGTTGMFQQLLAQRGVAVWSCDNRSASGKGAVSAWTCYQKLGEGELSDIEDSIAWLKAQPWVDASRIGITGWSYGGFMTSYALTHSESFALGLAGGSVTDWRWYDSIYTERLMREPRNNPEGYARTSVVAAASKLHGKLVLVHGQLDDNVHAKNTLRLAYALQRANADFDFMLYPKSRHGLGEGLTRHWRAVMLRAIEEVLLAPGKS